MSHSSWSRSQWRRWWIFVVIVLGSIAPMRLMMLSTYDSNDLFETNDWTPGTSSNLSPSSDNKTIKIALYITTHFSEPHIRYFHCCWPRLVAESPLIRQANVIVAATNSTPIAENELDYLRQLFHSNPSFQFWTPTNTSHLSHCEPFRIPQNPNKLVSVSYKQCLANYGVAFGWPRILQQGYDWMIRLNPDVLIRQSQWLLQSMQFNTSLDAILIHCGEGTRQIHTDFWAIRPSILEKDAFQRMAKIGNHLNHERTAFQHFRPTIAGKRHAWLDNVDPSEGTCRVRGPRAPVSHEHDSCTSADDMICHGLEGWDLSQ